MKRTLLIAPVFLALALVAPASSGAAEINWSKVPALKVNLFYPGVTSWEFVNGEDHKLGSKDIQKGRRECAYCHVDKDGAFDLKTDEIASGALMMKKSRAPFEPEPQSGKKGTLPARVQAAYDSEYLYVRVEWDSAGTSWQRKVSSPDRVSLQMNKAEPSFRKYGCFITCHNDLTGMPNSPAKKELEARGLEDSRLYAYYARKSWAEKRPGADARLKDGLIDLKAVEFETGRSTMKDGWVFDGRNWDEKGGAGAGSWANGKYTAVIKEKLRSTDKHDISVAEGEAVAIAIAIHDAGASKRKHYVSLPITIGIGADGDIKAVKAN